MILFVLFHADSAGPVAVSDAGSALRRQRWRFRGWWWQRHGLWRGATSTHTSHTPSTQVRKWSQQACLLTDLCCTRLLYSTNSKGTQKLMWVVEGNLVFYYLCGCVCVCVCVWLLNGVNFGVFSQVKCWACSQTLDWVWHRDLITTSCAVLQSWLVWIYALLLACSAVLLLREVFSIANYKNI